MSTTLATQPKGNARGSGYERADIDALVNEVRRLFVHDPSIGSLRRIVPSGRAKAGNTAGAACRGGYRQIRMFGRLYMEHRLVWLWFFGEWPNAEIDHINGIRTDNRIENLRIASRSDNCRNRRAALAGRLKGTTKRPRGRWKAQICVDRKKISLGTFNTAEQAHAAYCRAATQFFGEFARAA